MPLIDLYIFVIFIALVVAYVIIRFGFGRKIGKFVNHEKEVIKNEIEIKKENDK